MSSLPRGVPPAVPPEAPLPRRMAPPTPPPAPLPRRSAPPVPVANTPVVQDLAPTTPSVHETIDTPVDAVEVEAPPAVEVTVAPAQPEPEPAVTSPVKTAGSKKKG